MQFFDFHHHQKSKYGIYNLTLKEDIPDACFSIGIHPKDVLENNDSQMDILKKISEHSNCLAIGECGLDGLIPVEETLQEQVFQQQILWANEINKPLIIHCVRRFSQLLKFKKMAQTPMIVHGFNKKETIAKQLFEAGFFLSFGKAVLHNVSLQSLVKDFPINKIFLETDGEDFSIHLLYEKVAELKRMSIESLQNQMFENLEYIKNL